MPAAANAAGIRILNRPQELEGVTSFHFLIANLLHANFSHRLTGELQIEEAIHIEWRL